MTLHSILRWPEKSGLIDVRVQPTKVDESIVTQKKMHEMKVGYNWMEGSAW